MKRTSAPNSVGGLHQNGNPFIPNSGTVIEARSLNEPQEEIVRLIEWAGLTPSGSNLDQLREAIAIMHARGLPLGQGDAIAALGLRPPESVRSSLLLNSGRGRWTCGSATSAPAYADYYEEGAGEFYNCFAPQTAQTGLEVHPASDRLQDEGIWIPKGYGVSGDELVVRCGVRVKQFTTDSGGAGGARTFSFVVDFNSDVFNKHNAWGSNSAIKWQCSFAQDSYTTLTVGEFELRCKFLNKNSQFWTAKLEIPSPSGGAPDVRTWSQGDFTTPRWDFTAPTVGAGYTDHAGNTMLQLRFAALGAQDRRFRVDFHNFNAYVYFNGSR